MLLTFTLSTNKVCGHNERLWSFKWIIKDSNLGPTGYEPVALTNCANDPYRLITELHCRSNNRFRILRDDLVHYWWIYI